MDLINTLADPIFTFPIESSIFFPSHLRRLFSHYLELLESIDDEFKSIIVSHLPDIKKTCDSLINETDAIFRGDNSSAYAGFSKTITRLQNYLLWPDKNAVELNPNHLFKARRTMDNHFTLTDMYHVPFEKRYQINSTRFSLPGVPCLYLGNSIYTCWEELERPPFNQMPVSRFELSRKNFKFLDFSNSKDFIKQAINPSNSAQNSKVDEQRERELFQNMKELVCDFVLPRYIQTYPLLAACYTKIYNSNYIFKPEYVFPQMVMQWIMTQDDIDGVKYLSTKCRGLSNEIVSLRQSFFNYAIPINGFKEKGYCDTMVKRIGLTYPITFEILSMKNPSLSIQEIDYNKDIKNKYVPSRIFYINLGAEDVPYLKSSFGILEHELMKMQIKHINQ